MVTAGNIVEYIQSVAPEALAEHDDPVGMHVGDIKAPVERLVMALDASQRVIQQAIDRNANMLVTHHPLVYRPLQRLTPDDPVSIRVIELIKHDIALYCAHTNLDRADGGNNDTLAELLELGDVEQIIRVGNQSLHKIAVFVPGDSVDRVAEAMGDAGAGSIGLYSHCSFRTSGTGYFKPLEGSHPHIGQTGVLESVEEMRLEMVCPESLVDRVISAMKASHPYEVPAYDIYELENHLPSLGLGRIGNLKNRMSLRDFAFQVERTLEVTGIRVYGECPTGVERVAVCSGAGSSFYREAMKHGADVLVTGDVKHHDAIDAQCCGIAIIDAGHFETERPGIRALAKKTGDEFADSGVEVEYVE